jgi:hypothetical protein
MERYYFLHFKEFELKIQLIVFKSHTYIASMQANNSQPFEIQQTTKKKCINFFFLFFTMEKISFSTSDKIKFPSLLLDKILKIHKILNSTQDWFHLRFFCSFSHNNPPFLIQMSTSSKNGKNVFCNNSNYSQEN